MQFDPNIRYACLQCGKSCRQDWNIWVSDSLPQRYQPLRVLVGDQELFVQEGEQLRLARDSAGCKLLRDRLCLVHSQLGHDQKPKSCQQYPLLLVETPDGLRVSASYTCTAVLQSHGPPLHEHRAEVEGYLARGAHVFKVVAVADWPEIQALEIRIEEACKRSGWDEALRHALSVLGGWQVDGRVGDPNANWDRDRHRDMRLGDALPGILGGLLKPCLEIRQPEFWQKMDQALFSRGELDIPEFSYRGNICQLLEWATQPGPGEADLDRYRHSLWFRKQHLCCNGLLPGLLMMWSLGPLFRVLARLSSPHAALDRIELNLLGHTPAGRQFYPLLCQYWTNFVGQTPDGMG